MFLHTIGSTLFGDKIYFTSCDFNALFCMDLKERRIEYKNCFEVHSRWKSELYEKQILHQNKIYFIPRNCNKVAVYDIETEKINYIEVPDKGGAVIRDSFIEDGCLWMLYAVCPVKIFKVDLVTGKYEVINVEWRCSNEDVIQYAKRIGDNWWMLVSNQCCLINYNWKKNKIMKSHYFKNLKNNFFRGDIQEQVWVISKDTNVLIEYDYHDETEKCVPLPELDKFSSEVINVILYKEYVVVLKREGIALINNRINTIKYYRFLAEKRLLNFVIYNNKMILFPARGRGLLVLDTLTESIREYDFEWNEKLTKENMEKFFRGNLSERVCNLASFEDLIISGSKRESDSSKNNGSNIWKALLNEARIE